MQHTTASTCSRQYSDAQISPPGHSSLSQQADLLSEGQADRAVTTAPCAHAQGRATPTGRLTVLYSHAACQQQSSALLLHMPPHTPAIKANAAATVLPPSRAHTGTHKSIRARSTQSSTCRNQHQGQQHKHAGLGRPGTAPNARARTKCSTVWQRSDEQATATGWHSHPLHHIYVMWVRCGFGRRGASLPTEGGAAHSTVQGESKGFAATKAGGGIRDLLWPASAAAGTRETDGCNCTRHAKGYTTLVNGAVGSECCSNSSADAPNKLCAAVSAHNSPSQSLLCAARLTP